VDDSAYGGTWAGLAPIEGQVYVFVEHRGVTTFPNGAFQTLNGLPLNGGGRLWIKRFQPLITRTQEQDLELFRPLLVPSPIDAGLVPAGVELVP